MRHDLPRFGSSPRWRHSHLALAYDAWAPVEEAAGDDAGKVPVKRPGNDRFREQWLAALEDIAIDGDYPLAFGHWERSLTQAGAAMGRIELASRLLVGHGNASATEVGLTVHHTWGVPMIPGSALKGLCAHYTAATYGPPRKEASPTPSNLPAGDERFSGPRWAGSPRRVNAPPGDFYRALFGAPDVGNDPASAGLVVFHDALYVPGYPEGPHANKPFAVDVLTVHQRSYYGQATEEGLPGQRWPNDYDSPNPVGFVSVRPGARLLLAVGGDAGWAILALELLTEALRTWGAGGKTSAGYGRAR